MVLSKTTGFEDYTNHVLNMKTYTYTLRCTYLASKILSLSFPICLTSSFVGFTRLLTRIGENHGSSDSGSVPSASSFSTSSRSRSW